MGKFKPSNQLEKTKRTRTYHEWIAKADTQINNLERYKTEHTEPYTKAELGYLTTITMHIRNCFYNALHHAKCPREQVQHLSDMLEIFSHQSSDYKKQKKENNLFVMLENENAKPSHSTKTGFVYDAALVKERRERKESNTAQTPIQTDNNPNMTLDLNIAPIQRPISQAKTVTLFGHTFKLNDTSDQSKLEVRSATLSL